MYLNTKVERESDDALNKEVWNYYLLEDGQLKLSSYEYQERSSLRHKYKIKFCNGKLGVRNTIESIPIREDIIYKAKIVILRKLRDILQLHNLQF